MDTDAFIQPSLLVNSQELRQHPVFGGRGHDLIDAHSPGGLSRLEIIRAKASRRVCSMTCLPASRCGRIRSPGDVTCGEAGQTPPVAFDESGRHSRSCQPPNDGLRLAGLGHLHEGQNAFLHAGPTQSAIEHNGRPLGRAKSKVEPASPHSRSRWKPLSDKAAVHDA